MLKCECGGILAPIAVEEYPSDLTSKERLNYQRVCDVECQKCGNIYYSQLYDESSNLRLVRKTKILEIKNNKE